MLSIVDDKIYMIRGDDEVLDAALSNDGEELELRETETLTLTVRAAPIKTSPVVLSSTSAPGSTRIVINHSDTADAEPGYYSADIQLMTAEGLRKTVWPVFNEEDLPDPKPKNMKNFILLPEVTMQ